MTVVILKEKRSRVLAQNYIMQKGSINPHEEANTQQSSLVLK